MIANSTKALITTIFASFLFGVMALLVKILSAHLSGAEILFMRALISVLLITLVVKFAYKRIKIKNINMLIVRGVFGGLAVLLYFTAISRIPLSSAAILANTFPLFAILFSAVIIKEKPRFDSVAALLVAFGGMFLILDPKFGLIDIGYVLALVSAIFGGVAVMSIKELRKTDSSWIIALSQMVGALFICFPVMVWQFKWPTLNQWGLLVLMGIVGTGAQVVFTRPFKFIPTAEGAMVAPGNTAFTLFFAVLFLNETLSRQFLFGAALIFLANLYLIGREEYQARKMMQ